ncbi:MAG: hypothetical protein HUJ27_01835 [Rhodobacteraceae bacterium]|nr:hypothetical protein [Paracoccaceae bacterium]
MSALEKSDLRTVRDAIASTYPEGSKVRRSGLNCYALVRDCYVCFNIQNDKYKPTVGLKFCVNWGVVPVKVFVADPHGFFGNTPSYLYADFLSGRGRLTKSPSLMDQWFAPKTTADLNQVAVELQTHAERLWEDRLLAMTDANWHIETWQKRSAPIAKEYLAALLGH